jgi:hypothetical protein
MSTKQTFDAYLKSVAEAEKQKEERRKLISENVHRIDQLTQEEREALTRKLDDEAEEIRKNEETAAKIRAKFKDDKLFAAWGAVHMNLWRTERHGLSYKDYSHSVYGTAKLTDEEGKRFKEMNEIWASLPESYRHWGEGRGEERKATPQGHRKSFGSRHAG